MQHINVPQYSAEWFRARLGIPTASCADKLLTPKGYKLSAQSEKYANQLLAEWLLQTPFEQEVNVWAVDVGMEREAEAVQFYELTTGRETQECGFCLCEDGSAGCSPDRFVGEEGLLEVKCPIAPTLVGYLLAGDVPSDYTLQLQMQLYVTQRPWVDFLAYHPGMSSLLVRVEPDPHIGDALANALAVFNLRLEAGKRILSALKGEG